MQILPPATQAHLAARSGRHAHILIWIEARNRATGAVETMGLWTGPDHQQFEFGEEMRDYYGASALLSSEPISAKVGLEVRMHQIQLSPISPEVALLIRGYDARLAPVEIHRALFDPLTGQLIDTPLRRFKGWVDDITLPTAPPGEDTICTLMLTSNARAGTSGLTLKQSDESQKLRLLPDGAPDRFYRYADVSGAVKVKWGES